MIHSIRRHSLALALHCRRYPRNSTRERRRGARSQNSRTAMVLESGQAAAAAAPVLVADDVAGTVEHEGRKKKARKKIRRRSTAQVKAARRRQLAAAEQSQDQEAIERARAALRPRAKQKVNNRRWFGALDEKISQGKLSSANVDETAVANLPAVTAPMPAQMPAQMPTAMQMQGGMYMYSLAASGQHNFPPPHQAQAHGMQKGCYVQGHMCPPPVPQMQQGYVSYGTWGMPPPHAHSSTFAAFEAGVAEGKRQMWAQMQAQAQGGMGQYQWTDPHQQYQPDYMGQHQEYQQDHHYLQSQRDYHFQEYQRHQHYHQSQYQHQNQYHQQHQLQQHQLQQQEQQDQQDQQQQQQEHGDDAVDADGSCSAPRAPDGAARDDEAEISPGKAELGDDASAISTSSGANRKEDDASRSSANRHDNHSSQTNAFNSKPPSVGDTDDGKDEEDEQHSHGEGEVLAQCWHESVQTSTTTSSPTPSGANPEKKNNPSRMSIGRRKQRKKSRGSNQKRSNAAKRKSPKQSQQPKGGTKLTLPEIELGPSAPTSTTNIAATDAYVERSGAARAIAEKRVDSTTSADTIDTTSEVADLSTPHDTADSDRPRATSREMSEEKKNEKKKKRPKKNTIAASVSEEVIEFQIAAVDAAACRPREMSSDTEDGVAPGPMPPNVETLIAICVAECARRSTQKLRLEDGRSDRAFVDPNEVRKDHEFMVLMKEECRAAHRRLYSGKSKKNRRRKAKVENVTVDLSPSYDFRIIINRADVEKVALDLDALDQMMADRNESEERDREIQEQKAQQQKEADEKAQAVKELVTKVKRIKLKANLFRSKSTESRYCISGMVNLDHTSKLFCDSVGFSPSVNIKNCLKGVLNLLTDAVDAYRSSHNVGYCNVLEALTLVSPRDDYRPHLNPDLVGAIFSRVDVRVGLLFLDDEPVANAKESLGTDLDMVKREIFLQSEEAKEAASLLGVPIGADATTIKRAYRKQSIRLHPDKADANNMAFEEAHQKFKALSAARELLLDCSTISQEEP